MSRLLAYKKEILTGIAIGFLLYFLLKNLFPLFSPFLLAYLTIYSVYPLLYKMEQKCKINKTITAVIIMLLVLVVLVSVLWLLYYLFQKNMDKFFGGVNSLFGNIESFITQISYSMQDRFGFDGSMLEEYFNYQLKHCMDSIKAAGLPDMMLNSVSFFKKLLPMLAFIGIYIVATILFTKDFDKIMEQVHKIGALDAFMSAVSGLLHTIGVYLKAQIVIIFVIAVICCIGLRAFGISYPYLLGILAGLLDALPFIGTGVILIPTALIQLICGNTMQAIVCVVIYVVCIVARELLEPRLMGKSFGIYPVILLLSIYAGIQLFGITGIMKGPLGVVIFKQLFTRLFPVKS